MPASRLVDLNAFAIHLVEDHPGHPYVAPLLDEGLAGKWRLLVPDYVPIRARWLLQRWGARRADAEDVVRAFLEEQPRVQYVAASRDGLLRAFDLAQELGHDVYDTFYLVLALEHGADALLTTDTGLRRPCQRVGLDYENPVPPSVLRRFAGYARG